MIKLDTTRILIPTDFTMTAAKAVKHAAFLAQLNKGELILLHVYKRKDFGNLVFPYPALREEVLQKKELLIQLEHEAEKIRHDYNIPVTTKVESGHLQDTIVKTAEKLKAGLIVMGTRGDDSTSSLIWGNNSNRVVTRSTIPVMTVRTNADHIGYSNILLPINLSDHSRQKVNYAIEVAKLFAATLNVVGLLDEDEIPSRYKMDVILKQVRTLASARNVICHTRLEITEDAGETTLTLAEELRSDLVITMTDEKAGIAAFFDRNYDKQLVDESNIPVLSLPPETSEDDLGSISVAGM
jgi:nucleotide-binding universal stress UspA family protein